MLAEEGAEGMEEREEVVRVAGRGRIENGGKESGNYEAVDCIWRGGLNVVGKICDDREVRRGQFVLRVDRDVIDYCGAGQGEPLR